jgi:hypothetical protein
MTQRVIARDIAGAHDEDMTNTDTTTNTTAADTTANTDTDTRTYALSATVDTHLAAYCEPDPARRADLIASVWSARGSVFDPPFEGSGHDGISAMTDTVLTHFPGHRFRRTSEIDAHHVFGRYSWELVAPDGATAVTGTDIVEVDDAGQLTRIIGFFGEVSPLPST